MAAGDFFTDADMAELRAVASSAQASTAIIRRQSNTADGMGGFTQSRVAVGTVPCHVYAANQGQGRERVSGGQVISKAEWIVGVPFGTDVTETDWIDVSDTTYLVEGIDSGTTWAAELKCMTTTLNREQRA